MAIMFEREVSCGCGETLTTTLAEGVNIARTPKARDEILAGTFHTVTCPRCKRVASVEKSFLYTDLARNTVIQVKPRQDRHQWRSVADTFRKRLDLLSDNISPAKSRIERVVFGLAELREKLLAQDLGIDDQFLEVLKIKIVHSHPFLLDEPRLRLIFDGERPDGLSFVATYDLSDRVFRVTVAGDDAERMHEARPGLADVLAKAAKIDPYALARGLWVNVWRASPEPDALADLQEKAKTLRETGEVELTKSRVQGWLHDLPQAANLPTWAKADVDLLFAHVRAKGDEALQELLFEIRFGKGISSEWGQNPSRTDIGTLWDILRALPESHTTGNAWLDEIILDPTINSGLYYPTTHDIHIGATAVNRQEYFEDTLRHEVGHAVHGRYAALVDTWLTETWRFRMFPRGDAGIEAWIAAMGGWESLGDLSAQERQDVIGFITDALGGTQVWGPGEAPVAPDDHVWNSNGFAPRLAYEKSQENWFDHNATWLRIGDQAFAMNFWYARPMAVHVDTLALIGTMPKAYAAMSPDEFFAELYGLYFDRDDPARNAVPPDAQGWLAQLGV